MESLVLLLVALICAIQAVRSAQLLIAALWLAGVSACIALFLYALGAHAIAVIELSVGAGLVTILMVFAITMVGEDSEPHQPVVPRWMAIALPAAVLILAAGLLLNAGISSSADAAPDESLSAVLWQLRGADVAAQLALIFAGVLGLLALLADDREEPGASSLWVEAESDEPSAQFRVAEKSEVDLEEVGSPQ